MVLGLVFGNVHTWNNGLNFDVDSWPGAGAYMIFVGMMLTVVAFFVGKKEYNKIEK